MNASARPAASAPMTAPAHAKTLTEHLIEAYAAQQVGEETGKDEQSPD